MKTTILLPLLFVSACATTGSKGASAPFQGQDVVTKRRGEIADAGKAAMDCMKSKDAQAAKGGIFAVMADASGKLAVQPVKWSGPDTVKQCIVDAGNKATVTPLPGPSVGTLWEFQAPGEKGSPGTAPEDLAVKMQPLSETMQGEVVSCEQRELGNDFPATIDVSYFLYNDGKAYAPTVISSDAKSGNFDSCVQDVILHTKFPVLAVDKPFGTTAHFKVGIYGDTQRTR